MTSSAFRDLNRKPAEPWNVPDEVNRALTAATPGHPLKAGASSRIMKHEKGVKIPLEGGPDSARNG
jgi:hypothetical protein